jgi:hypothetical protein
MKRFLLMLVAAFAVAAVVAGSVAASDTKGPPCTNIISGTAGYAYDSSDSSGTVQAIILELGAPACAGESYVVEIYDIGGANLLATANQDAVPGETQPAISYSFAAGTAPADGVCVVVETFYKKHLSDRGPDSGCFPVPPNEGGGGNYA